MRCSVELERSEYYNEELFDGKSSDVSSNHLNLSYATSQKVWSTVSGGHLTAKICIKAVKAPKQTPITGSREKK